MEKLIVHESEIEELARPGRFMKWLITADQSGAEFLSSVLIRIPPGETVKPAHSHPNGEEMIYIIRGSGKVYINGRVNDVRQGSAVLFPRGSVHMLRNNGEEEMRVICFFAPPSDLSTYRYYENVEFPDH